MARGSIAVLSHPSSENQDFCSSMNGISATRRFWDQFEGFPSITFTCFSIVFSLLAERKSSISLTVDNFRRFDSLQGHFLPRSQHLGTPPVARLAVNPPAAVRVVLNPWADSVFPGETVDSPARK